MEKEEPEPKHKLEVKTVSKPFRIPKDKLSEFKGLMSKRTLSRLKSEAVDCPVKGETVPFLECFTCKNFVRRVKGYVYCNG